MADTNKPRTAAGNSPRVSQKPRREPPSKRREREKIATRPRLPLGRKNWITISIGLATILLGFLALSRGSITLAPFLLVIGYCVLLPLGIMLPDRGRGEVSEVATGPGSGE